MPKTRARPPQRRVMVEDALIGDRVRYRRNLIKMTQSELGGKIGTSFQQIQKYEKGMNRISGSRLLQIAEALGCSLEDLLGRTSATPAKSNPFTKFAASKDGIAIIEAMSKISSSRMRRRIIQIAEAVADRSTPRRP